MSKKDISDFKDINNLQYQANSFISEKIEKNNCALCITPVGTGKTRIACNEIERILLQTKNDRHKYILVLCPSESIIDDSWETELSEKGIKHIKLSSYNFPDFRYETLREFSGPKSADERVFLTTYALFSHPDDEGKNNNEYFLKNPPYMLVIDEIHNISNSADDNFKLFRNTITQIDYKKCLGLTATPLVNSEKELKQLARILKGNEKDFESFSFIVNGEHTNFHRKDIILDIPLQQNIEDECLSIMDGVSPIIIQQNVSTLMLQGCIKQNKKIKERFIPENSKTAKEICLIKLLENIPAGDKIIIFDDFIDNLLYLSKQEWMKPYNPTLFYGQLGSQRRERNLNNFKKNKDMRVLLATRQIAGAGLNLQNANHCIIITCPWTSKDLIQMEGRVNRTNQVKNTYSYILTNLEIDQKMQAALNKNLKIERFIGKNAVSSHKFQRFTSLESFENDFSLWLEQNTDMTLTRLTAKLLEKIAPNENELIEWLKKMNLQEVNNDELFRDELEIICTSVILIFIENKKDALITLTISEIADRHCLDINSQNFSESVLPVFRELMKLIKDKPDIRMENLFSIYYYQSQLNTFLEKYRLTDEQLNEISKKYLESKN